MLVGRSESLRVVRAAIAARRPTVLVGEAGIGKTTRLREAVAPSRAEQRGPRDRRLARVKSTLAVASTAEAVAVLRGT